MNTILPHPRTVLAKLPVLMAKPIAHSPFALQKSALQILLTTMLREALEDGDCRFLQGHWLKVQIDDVGICWDFTLDDQGKIQLSRRKVADVTIRGSLKSFLLLAARKEDPDTLFFQRDLVIEGNTELGLEIKNLLDSLEIEQLPPELIFLLKSGAEYVTLFSQ